MAAGFWWYPTPDGPASFIALNRPIVDRPGPFQAMRQSTSTSWNDSITTVQWGGSERITVKHRWGGTSTADRLVRRNLVAFMNHLRRGGHCVFAEDVTKLQAAFVQVAPGQGDTFVSIHTPFTDELLTAPGFASQEVVLRSSAPEVLIEAAFVQSQTGSGIVLSQGAALDFTDQAWVMLREWGTWPVMRLPADKRNDDLLLHDYERAFTIELPLEEDEQLLGILAAINGPLASTDNGQDGVNLEQDTSEPPNLGGGGGLIGLKGGF